MSLNFDTLEECVVETRRYLQNCAMLNCNHADDSGGDLPQLPELTDVMMHRPPFYFLKEVVMAVIAKSPLMNLLSSDEVLKPGNAFSKPEKLK